MNAYLSLILLGLIQGLTEFLPVSSSGHLVLFSKIFGVEESLFVSIILHVATLFSIVCVLHKEIFQMIRHPFSKQSVSLATATIPTCIVVLILLPLVKKSFAGALLPLCFAISAVILVLAEVLRARAKPHFSSVEISSKVAIAMGLAQGFAVFPGISRSGATISAGLISGADKAEAAKFSFLMSIPIVFLSLLMEIYEILTTGAGLSVQFLPTALGFLVAFGVGIFAIKFMIKITATSSLKIFAAYLVVISVVSLFFV